MLPRIKEYWNYGNRYASVEITTVEGKQQYFIVTSKKEKNEFEKIDSFSTAMLEGISDKLGKKLHTFLSVNTEDVLIKESKHYDETLRTVTSAFPGLNINNFYYQIVSSPSKCFVAICRKEVIQNILEEFEDHAIHVLGVTLGFTAIANIAASLNGNSIPTNRHEIKHEQGKITSFGPSSLRNIDFEVGDFRMNEGYLLALSGLNFYEVPIDMYTSNLGELNRSLQKSYAEAVFFNNGLKIGVGILLILLLGNFILYNTAFKKNQYLQEQVALSSNQKEIVTQRQTSLEAKERLVNNILLSGHSKSSFYLNQLVSKMPDEILLTKIIYQPLSRSIRPDKVIEFEAKTIIVSGENVDKDAFTNWVNNLENSDWIDSIVVTEYSNQGSNDAFTLKISQHNESED